MLVFLRGLFVSGVGKMFGFKAQPVSVLLLVSLSLFVWYVRRCLFCSLYLSQELRKRKPFSGMRFP